MLVTFKCKHFHDILMFGDVGVELLKAMGKSGKVPGTIRGDEAAEALSQLRSSMDGKVSDTLTTTDNSDYDDTDDNDKRQAAVSLRQRAIPLVEMLEVAADKGCDILWE